MSGVERDAHGSVLGHSHSYLGLLVPFDHYTVQLKSTTVEIFKPSGKERCTHCDLEHCVYRLPLVPNDTAVQVTVSIVSKFCNVGLEIGIGVDGLHFAGS